MIYTMQLHLFVPFLSFAFAFAFSSPQPSHHLQGSPCMQANNQALAPGNYSEDCLFLNIYLPSSARLNSSAGDPGLLPVMLWIHGGYFVWGTANLYDGTTLTSTGNIIVVTLNYRLGPFGSSLTFLPTNLIFLGLHTYSRLFSTRFVKWRECTRGRELWNGRPTPGFDLGPTVRSLSSPCRNFSLLNAYLGISHTLEEIPIKCTPFPLSFDQNWLFFFFDLFTSELFQARAQGLFQLVSM